MFLSSFGPYAVQYEIINDNVKHRVAAVLWRTFICMCICLLWAYPIDCILKLVVASDAFLKDTRVYHHSISRKRVHTDGTIEKTEGKDFAQTLNATVVK